MNARRNYVRIINLERGTPRVNDALSTFRDTLSTSGAGKQAHRMTAPEVRTTVLAYHRIQDLLTEPLPSTTRERFQGFLEETEKVCHDVSATSIPSRWARAMVGPVLAAGLGATIYMREDVASPSAALRSFGLSGDRALSNQAAWNILQPYRGESVLSEKSLAAIRRVTGMKMQRLAADPGPVDVLLELTRMRAGNFAAKMTHWLTEYFRTHADADTPYGNLYRSTLHELSDYNRQGEMAHMVDSVLDHTRYHRQDWEALVHGRMPQARLEMRAGFIVTKHFIADYWARWNPEVPERRRPPKETDSHLHSRCVEGPPHGCVAVAGLVQRTALIAGQPVLVRPRSGPAVVDAQKSLNI